jgi:superfamily II DNA or RNA helicase
MVSLDNVLSRADISGLEKLIGLPAVKLLSLLDRKLLRSDELRRLLFNLYSPAELLASKESWHEIVDLLREDEASELARILGAKDKQTPWHTLRTIKFGRHSKRLELACAFFGFSLPDDEPESIPESVKRVNPTYGLFAHQQVAGQSIQEALGQGNRRAVLHMPTGSGKTRTAMHVICNHIASERSAVVVWLAYSEELCEQAASEFESSWQSLGNRPVTVIRFWGKHEADLNECQDGIVVAGLSKMYSRLRGSTSFIANLADATSLIIIDEAHQAVAETYSTVLDILQSKRQDSSILGLTATPGRSWDDLDEDRILAEFFGNQKVSLSISGYSNPIDYLVSEGYLAQPIFKDLHYKGGSELSETDLVAIRQDLDVPEKILESLGKDEQRNLLVLVEVEKLAKEHRRILVFSSSVEGAKLLATALDAHGVVEARAVTGTTPADERRRRINWYKEKTESPRILCNYGVLTTGFDAPLTSAAVICRPTKSLVLYSQMVGRAIRGERAGGNRTAEIVTVVDRNLPGFRDLSEFFTNWEDAGWHTK